MMRSSRHDVTAWNALAFAVPNDQRARTCEISQRFEHAFATQFLNDTYGDRKAGKYEKDNRVHRFTQKEINHPASQKKSEHWLAHDVVGHAKDIPAVGIGNLIVTECEQSLRDFRRAQPKQCVYIGHAGP